MASAEDDIPAADVVNALSGAIRNSGTTCREWTEAFFRAWQGFGRGPAPFRGDDGNEAWALAFYSYAAQYPNEGEVRGTLFLNANGTYTHLMFSTMSGQFVQNAGVELDDVYPSVHLSIFANERAESRDGGFVALGGSDRTESLADVLARSLSYYGTGVFPPIFTPDAHVR